HRNSFSLHHNYKSVSFSQAFSLHGVTQKIEPICLTIMPARLCLDSEEFKARSVNLLTSTTTPLDKSSSA
ncbi:hypothetical protein, partial [Turicimonas muris]|uniref:hypothetical protein n=1 Tax=Turicimonas muris TaxID=1796652 RepID=UPI002573A32F